VAGRGARAARPAAARARSQHFLRSSRLAAELVHDAEISRAETVLEIGAGTGRLTVELARRAGRVVAVEIDPKLAAALRRRFEATNVVVVRGAALEQPLPAEPFRVFANLPFHETNATLRYLLDDPSSALTRADLILQWDAARKRATAWPSTMRGAYWGAWYTLALVRRLPAGCFAPRPSVDAGLLSIRRRAVPLVPAAEAARYGRLLRAAFARPRLRDVVPQRELKRLADVYGFPRGAAARELDAHQWAAVFRSVVPPLAGERQRARGEKSSLLLDPRDEPLD
jgi:23S rRNA (adenine-N6)-dimethyltransferase